MSEELEIVRAIDSAADFSNHDFGAEVGSLQLLCAEMTSLMSWYLHWRGYWDLRVRLCSRVIEWAEHGHSGASVSEVATLIGNLYVDCGWVHLQRNDISLAEHHAESGTNWLRHTGDKISADELKAQIALRTGDAASAIAIFGDLRQSIPERIRS